ncbi:MAG: GGDEF domain-containing protein [Lachnospiraceae bacterium]
MKNIAVLVAGLTINTITEVTDGIRDCAVENNCNVFFFTCERRYEKSILHDVGEYNIFNLPHFSEFDGVILVNSTIGSGELLSHLSDRIVRSGTPAVSLEYYHPDMYNVMIDNKTAMKQVVSHFVLDHGFRRIDFITGPLDNAEARERLEAYREVLFENGIPVEKKRIFIGNYLKESGKAAAEYFLETESELPDAIISSNDVMATGVYVYLQEKGILVPEQVAISGFDDETSARYFEPRLTSVAREQYKSGYLACRKLVGGLCEIEKGDTYILETKLMKRESCGCVCSDIIDNVKFRKSHFQKEESTERFMQETREMAIELTTVETLGGLKQAMKKYVQHIGCESFHLLLCREWEGYPKDVDLYELSDKSNNYLREGYGTDCELVFGYADSKFIEQCEINLGILIADLKENLSGKNIYTVSPLHYRDRCFGYCIIGNSIFPFENQLFYTWTMNIGNAIETIREQYLLRAMIKKLNSIWIYDNLTGLYNRAGFHKYGGYVWRECIQKNQIAMLLFLDLDGLKCVNDTYGHDEGDRFIKTVSGILKRCKHHGEIIMRYGGDEFVILSSNVSEDRAENYRSRILEEMKSYNESHKLSYQISASIGIYLTKPERQSELEEAIEEADRRMYEVKKIKKCQRV